MIKCMLLVLSGAVLALNISFASGKDISWKKYPYSPGGSDIVFPKDEGRHTGIPNMEWWYTVMHLKGEQTGHHYSVLVTHFNNQIRFFTITNLDEKKHFSDSTLGILRSKKGRLDIQHQTKFGTDIFRSRKDSNGKLIPFEYELQTHGEKINIKASMKSLKRPLLVTGDGYVTVGSSGFSYYYSLSRMDVTGELEFNGRSEKVSGLGWMDHQWGPFMVSPFEIGKAFESYEWFCLQLDNGDELMISNIFDRQNRLPQTEDYGGVEWIKKNGESLHTHKKIFKRTGFWRDPVSGNLMSMGWELNIPEWDMTIKLSPDLLDQMVRLPLKGSFWEGSLKASGRIGGQFTSGKGFGELIHRYEIPQLSIKKLPDVISNNVDIKLNWEVKNPDDGMPLTYKVELIANGKSKILAENLLKNGLTISLNQYPDIDLNHTMYFKVTAESLDGSVKSQEKSSIFRISR